MTNAVEQAQRAPDDEGLGDADLQRLAVAGEDSQDLSDGDGLGERVVGLVLPVWHCRGIERRPDDLMDHLRDVTYALGAGLPQGSLRGRGRRRSVPKGAP